MAHAGVIGLAAAWLVALMVAVAGAQPPKSGAATMKNPVTSTAEPIAAGTRAYHQAFEFCHSESGTGTGALAPKSTHPPNLVDAKWDPGSTDGEIFVSIKEAIGPKFDTKPMEAKMTDTEIWNVINYL